MNYMSGPPPMMHAPPPPLLLLQQQQPQPPPPVPVPLTLLPPPLPLPPPPPPPPSLPTAAYHYESPQLKPPPPLPLPVHLNQSITPPQNHSKNANDWIFNKSEMFWTPTHLQNEQTYNIKDIKDESGMKFSGASAIFAIGIVYHAPQELMATAQVLYQRFYMRTSLHEANYFEHAAAALWVAWKVDFDAPMIPKLSEYLIVVARKAERNDNLQVDPNGQVWTKWKLRLQNAEQLLCDTLCWDLYVELPYTYMFDIGRMLGTTRSVADKAIAIVNDSCRIPLLLQYHPREVAIAAIYFATIMVGEDLRIDAWLMTKADVNRVREIVREMIQMYTTRHLYKPPIAQSTPQQSPHH